MIVVGVGESGDRVDCGTTDDKIGELVVGVPLHLDLTPALDPGTKVGKPRALAANDVAGRVSRRGDLWGPARRPLYLGIAHKGTAAL